MMKFMEPSRIEAHTLIKSSQWHPPLSACFPSIPDEKEIVKTEANLFSIKGDGVMERGWGGHMDSVWILTFFRLDNHRPSVRPAIKEGRSVEWENEGVMSAVSQPGRPQIPDSQTKK